MVGHDVGLAGVAHEACTRTLAVCEWTQFAALLRTDGLGRRDVAHDAQTRLVQNLGFDGAIVRTEAVGS